MFHNSYTQRFLIAAVFVLALLPTATSAGISVKPKFLFLDGSRRSVPLYISNPGDDVNEVWIEMKYGYVVSDDSGKPKVFYDSANTDELSAAGWLKAYPQRFVINGGETQTVRLVALPPPGLREGEYWARVEVNGKSRKPPTSNLPTPQNMKSGMNYITRVGLAFHYRNGRVATGLVVNNIKAAVMNQAVEVTMNLTKTGNAAYWGSAKFQVINDAGRVVYSNVRNTVVYKNFLLRELIDRKEIPSGRYTVAVEFSTGKRNDIENSSLIQAPVVRASAPFDLP